MRALVDFGQEPTPSEERWGPTLRADTDAIVCVDALTACGEAIGTVEAVGPDVKTIEVGDRVLVANLMARDTFGFAERLRVPFADTFTCKVPDDVRDGELLMLATFFRRATPSWAEARAR